MSIPVRQRLEEARRTLEAAEQSVAALEQSLRAAQETAGKARVRIAELRQELTATQAQITAIQQRVATATTSLRIAQTNLQRLLRLMGQLESKGLPTDHLEPEIASAEEAIAAAQATIASENGRLPPLHAKRSGLELEIGRNETTAANADAQAASLTGQLNQARQRVETERVAVAALTAEQARFEEFHKLLGPLPAADLPMALLPVRIETRFIPAEAGFDLCVRVYPDDLHVDSHEPELLEDEVVLGRHFWEQVWRAASDEGRRKAAWAQLAQRFGPARAAWVVRAMKPANAGDRPEKPIPDGQPFTTPPQFPSPTTHTESWTRAPLVRALPDRWAVLGYRDGQRALFTWGERIRAELAAGPSPAAPRQDVPDDQLPLDAGMRWLVDFDEAVRAGMGLRVRLTAAEATRGYDDLLVAGLRVSLDGASGAAHLAALLDAQHYTDGLAFVAQGTPTNNTPSAAAGFQSTDPGFEESYGAEIAGGDVAQPVDNAGVSARALGVPAAIFSQIAGARGLEQADARAMNTALWPATWGYFLEQMMGDAAPAEQVSAIRGFFLGHVRGRGPLPALRAGRQPYALLPASSLDRWTIGAADPVRAALVKLLRGLRVRWRTALVQIPRVGRSSDPTAAGGDLLQLLAMEPVSSGFQARPVIDSILFGTPAIPQINNALPADVVARRQAASAAVAELGFAWRPRLHEMSFLETAFPLVRSLVQGSAEQGAGLAPNYLQWLLSADFASIRNEVYPPGFAAEGVKLDSLLYLLARHATLLAYADTAHRILLADKAVTTPRRPEPTMIGVLNTNGTSGLHELDKQAPSLGGARVGDRIHTLTRAEHPAAAELDEFRASLAHLSQRRAGELERLLLETLDCCAHRLDAWITALPAERLTKIRASKPAGILIGGYGWVQNVKPDTSRQPVAAPPGEPGRLMEDADSGGFIHAPSLNHAATAAVLRSGYRSNRAEAQQQLLAIDLSSERVRRAQWLLDGVRQGQALGALLGYRFERGLHENHPGVELDKFIDIFRKLAPLGELYQVRAEKEAARLKAEAHTASAAAKRTEAANITTQANQLVSQLQTSRTRISDSLSAAEAQAAELREEIRNSQVPVKPGKPVIDKDSLEALRKALRQVELRITSLKSQLANVDSQIPAAVNAQTAANARAQQLQNEAAGLDVEAQKERGREQAAAARERELLERRRAELLLPPAAGAAAMEALAAQDVVDGLALQKRYRKAIATVPARWDEETVPFGKLGLPAVNSPEFLAIVAELKVLDDSIDAVSDAVTAESVHQAVLGNPLRAGATLDAVAGGETPPPELDVVRSPRTGTAVTHRLLVLLPEKPAGGVAWPVDAREARAPAEPRLNAWATLLLGDPRRIRCRAEYLARDAVVDSREFALDALAISPLDLLWMAEARGSAAEGLLEQRLRYELLRGRKAEIPADAAVRLLPDRAAAWGPEILSIGEALQIARAVAELVSSSRPLDSRDLEPAESAGAATLDTTDLSSRVDRLVTAFTAAHTLLDGLVANPAGAAPEALRKALLALTYFDISAVPVSAVGERPEDRQALLDQAVAVRIETAKRLRQLQQLLKGVNRSRLGPAERLELERQRAAVVLGKAFRIVPRFKPSNAAALNQSLAAGDGLLAGDRLAPVTWLQRMARVRSGSARLNDVFTYAQCLTGGLQAELRVIQLPPRTGERWAALPFDPQTGPPAATLSLVAHVPPGFGAPLAANLAGLLIDEWVDVIPGSREQTAIAFHFDAPGSRPPQAVLLAVPPGDQSAWDLELIESIVVETLELARLRTVEPASLDDQVSYFLPALYFGLNLAGDTVSTNFERAATAAR